MKTSAYSSAWDGTPEIPVLDGRHEVPADVAVDDVQPVDSEHHHHQGQAHIMALGPCSDSISIRIAPRNRFQVSRIISFLSLDIW